MTADQRTRLRTAIDQAKRAEIDRAHQKTRAACACQTCTDQRNGLPVTRSHGAALYRSKIRCVCPVCRRAHLDYQYEQKRKQRRGLKAAA